MKTTHNNNILVFWPALKRIDNNIVFPNMHHDGQDALHLQFPENQNNQIINDMQLILYMYFLSS